MASPRRPPGGPRISASTTTRSCARSDSTRRRSTACVRAAPSASRRIRPRRRPHLRALRRRRSEGEEEPMSEIQTQRDGSVLRITLNRASKKNAMTSAMYLELAEAFTAAATDDGVHAVLWDAAGDSFSAGNDVEDFLKNPPGQ